MSTFHRALLAVLLCTPGAWAQTFPDFVALQSMQDNKPASAAQPAPAAQAAQPAPAPAVPERSFVGDDKASFLLSNERFHSDPEVLWPGFLSGLRGFDHFYAPVGNPLYFESPFNTTELRLLYLYHIFPRSSQIGGGNLNVWAAQIRVALTERWGFIATKDGWSDLNAGILPKDSGWNDFAIGTKYAFWVDREADWVMSGGIRWEWENGDRGVLQGADQELSPFVSWAKGWDRFHFIGNTTLRIPCDENDGNYIFMWDTHFDYEIAPEALPGLAPLVELRGLHYLTDGERMPLGVGAYDYSNIGSNEVEGNSVISFGLGFRWKFTPNFSIGSTWEFPLTAKHVDIHGGRLTADAIISW
jgi:hypothetical protein